MTDDETSIREAALHKTARAESLAHTQARERYDALRDIADKAYAAAEEAWCTVEALDAASVAAWRRWRDAEDEAIRAEKCAAPASRWMMAACGTERRSVARGGSMACI